ncbi:hypothetical protein [Halarchaeum sp. P4]|uniref:hypothetical protein n=1 Tax=Halarchaeum sp. P4 TaxID=3421639 RepID=UPI003EBE4C10
MYTTLAFVLFQVAALFIPAMLHIIGLLEETDNVSWRVRQTALVFSFASIVCFVAAGGTVLVYAYTVLALPPLLFAAVATVEFALLPFGIYVPLLYIDERVLFE